MVVQCAWLHPTQVHIQITSRYSFIDNSHEFVGSAKDHCVTLSQDNHTCEVSFLVTTATDVAQWKESFTGDLEILKNGSVSVEKAL